MADGIEFGV